MYYYYYLEYFKTGDIKYIPTQVFEITGNNKKEAERYLNLILLKNGIEKVKCNIIDLGNSTRKRTYINGVNNNACKNLYLRLVPKNYNIENEICYHKRINYKNIKGDDKKITLSTLFRIDFIKDFNLKNYLLLKVENNNKVEKIDTISEKEYTKLKNLNELWENISQKHNF